MKTSPNNLWTAKQLVGLRNTPRFPSLPDATDPVAINNALLGHFFPPKDPLPNRGLLAKNPSANPLTKEVIRFALSKSSPSSAPGPDGVPYSVWKKCKPHQPCHHPRTLLPPGAVRIPPPIPENRQRSCPGEAWQALLRLPGLLSASSSSSQASPRSLNK